MYKVRHVELKDQSIFDDRKKGKTHVKLTKLGVTKDLMAVFDNKLDGVISGLHICHFALEAVITHYGWRENHSKILWGHLPNVNEVAIVSLRS